METPARSECGLPKGEGDQMNDRIIREQHEQPEKEQVPLEIRQQQPVRAHPMESVGKRQQSLQQQLLRRTRWPALPGTSITKVWIERIGGLIRWRQEPLQRMADRDMRIRFSIETYVSQHGAA